MSASCPECGNPVLGTASRCGRCGAAFAASKGDPNLGRVVGNLKLVALLGKGGMGSVYRAEHVALGTPYAVKVLHPQFSHDETVAERFRREAVACSRLRHENTVFVTDFGIHDEMGIYLVMEYLEGASLSAVIKHERRLQLARFARVADQVCDAMAAAHRMGIVHRDLKPDNIMVIDDPSRGERVKVLDFGIAHLRDPSGTTSEKLTHAGMVVGTPAYMSPEQIDRAIGEVGPQSDIYSLGVIFYECVTGRLPYEGSSDLMMLTSHLTRTPDPLSALRPELSGTRLDALVRAMLTRAPAARVATMDGVRELLLDAMADLQDRGLIDDVAPFSQGRSSLPPPVASAPTMASGSFSPGFAAAQSPADASGQNPALRSNPSLHVTGVLRRIRAESPDSPAALLLAALPEADAMRGEALTLAVWGVLQQELLDAPTDHPGYAQSLSHLAMLFEAVLDAHKGPAATPAQEKLFRSLKNLLTLAPPERQRSIVEALTPQFEHPLFPMEALPKNLAPGRTSKTWDAVRGVMTREINLWPSNKTRETPRPSQPPAEGRASAPPSAPAAATPSQVPDAPAKDASLVDKLKKPVTVDAFKAVLTHEFSLFGSKKKE